MGQMGRVERVYAQVFYGLLPQLTTTLEIAFLMYVGDVVVLVQYVDQDFRPVAQPREIPASQQRYISSYTQGM
jgi:hypothetical protein